MKKYTHESEYLLPVISLIPLGKNAFLLSLERPFDFHAGQVISISLSPEDTPRYYSIASGTNDTTIDILFDVKPRGNLSPRLAGLRTGDIVIVTPPSGLFLGTEKPAVWIAAGTGIAPFRSMWRSGFKHDKMLIQGARSVDDLYFQEEFSNEPSLHYQPCVSGTAQEGSFPGRVTHFLESWQQLPADSLYYLCGRAEMVVDSREILLQKGIPYEAIVAEIYF